MSELKENIKRLEYSIKLGVTHWQKEYLENMKATLERLKKEVK